MAKTFPKTIYVKREEDGSDTYFIADNNVNVMVEMGETVKVAKYSLVETGELTGVGQYEKKR